MKIIILGSCILNDAFHKNIVFSENEEIIMKRILKSKGKLQLVTGMIVINQSY